MDRIELRNALFTAGASPSEVVSIKLPNGSELNVEVRGLSQLARGRLMDECMTLNEEGEQEAMSVEKMSPRIVIESCYVPGTSERVFTEGDLEAVGSLSATFLDPLFKKAVALSGLGKDQLKVAEGN